jgi:hypothetical protein
VGTILFVIVLVEAALVTSQRARAADLCEVDNDDLAWLCAADPARELVTVRPSLAAACRVMERHISDLLNQHRHTSDLDDAGFDVVLRMSQAAQSACTAERFNEGISLFSQIPLGRVTAPLH